MLNKYNKMSIELGSKGETIIHEIKSNGPFLTSVFYKIIQPTTIHILWKKYKGLKKDSTKSIWDWECEFEEINLGDFNIEGDTIIDVNEKYNSSSKVSRTLVFDNSNEQEFYFVNKDECGTSSDIYIITFSEDTKYVRYQDSWVDR